MYCRKLVSKSARRATTNIILKRRRDARTLSTTTTTTKDPLWTSSASSTLPSLNGLNGSKNVLPPLASSSKPIAQEEETTEPLSLRQKTNTKDAQTRRRRSSFSTTQKRYAVLVDSENAQLESMDLILREIRDSFDGDAIVRRVYGDFSRETRMRQWLDFCLAQSFLPVHAFTYVKGKGSSTDAVLIMDTMELLYTSSSSLDGFCFVTSDSDFTRLAQRLRESGKHVVGFGHDHTPEPFIASCESFVFVSDLLQRERDRQAAEKRRREEEERQEREAVKQEAAARAAAEEEEVKNSVTQQGLLGQMFQYLASFFSKPGETTDSLQQRFWKGLNLYTSSVSKNDPRTGERPLSTTKSSGVVPKSSVPRSELDSLHAIWKTYRNDDDYVQISVLAQLGGLDNIERYGYNKFSELILDHPDEFEVKRADDCKTLLAKSFKGVPPPPVEDDQLKRIHKGIQENSDGTGWANLAAVATSSEVDSSTYGYRKFSELVKQFPDEFAVKTTGTTMLVKSSTTS